MMMCTRLLWAVAGAALLIGQGQAAAQKIPEDTIISRFSDPAFPAVDANIQSMTPASLAPLSRPLEVKWIGTAGALSGTLDAIVATGPRPNVKARIRIYDHPIANAQAFSDGTITISTGLIDALTARAKTDQEQADTMYAFVLAHEYSHILLRHPQEREKTQRSYVKVRDGLIGLGVAYSIGANLAADNDESYRERRAREKDVQGVLLGSVLSGEVLAAEAKRAFFPGFAKQTERDADMLAVDLMQRLSVRMCSRIDPIAGVDALKTLPESNRSVVAKLKSLFKDAGETSAKTLKQMAIESPAMMTRYSKERVVRSYTEKAIETAIEFGAEKWNERQALADVHLHDTVKERTALVKAYKADKYPAKDAVKIDATAACSVKTDWVSVTQDTTGHRARNSALEALTRGDIPAARTAIDEALRSPIGASPDIQKIAGMVASAEGNPDLAIRHYRTVLADRNYQDETVYSALIEAYSEKGDYTSAVGVIDEARVALADPGAFLPTKIRILREAKKTTDMNRALADCRGMTDRKDLIEECEFAADPERSKGVLADVPIKDIVSGLPNIRNPFGK